MNTYKALVKITETVHTTSYVEVQATDAYKANLQVEALYGKANVIHAPILVK